MDTRQRRLPDFVVIPATIAVALLVIAGGTVEDSWTRTWACLGGAALSGVVFAVVCFVTPDQLGLGDAKLAVLLALTTAWSGPSAPVRRLVCAFVLADA